MVLLIAVCELHLEWLYLLKSDSIHNKLHRLLQFIVPSLTGVQSSSTGTLK